MMMAHQSGPTPPRLADETLAAVRTALTRSLEGDPASVPLDDALRDALSAMAHEARTQGMRAEQILVALKDLWASLPPVRRAAGRAQQTALLQRAVTLCINEYYAP